MSNYKLVQKLTLLLCILGVLLSLGILTSNATNVSIADVHVENGSSDVLTAGYIQSWGLASSPDENYKYKPLGSLITLCENKPRMLMCENGDYNGWYHIIIRKSGGGNGNSISFPNDFWDDYNNTAMMSVTGNVTSIDPVDPTCVYSIDFYYGGAITHYVPRPTDIDGNVLKDANGNLLDGPSPGPNWCWDGHSDPWHTAWATNAGWNPIYINTVNVTFYLSSTIDTFSLKNAVAFPDTSVNVTSEILPTYTSHGTVDPATWTISGGAATFISGGPTSATVRGFTPGDSTVSATTLGVDASDAHLNSSAIVSVIDFTPAPQDTTMLSSETKTIGIPMLNPNGAAVQTSKLGYTFSGSGTSYFSYSTNLVNNNNLNITITPNTSTTHTNNNFVDTNVCITYTNNDGTTVSKNIPFRVKIGLPVTQIIVSNKVIFMGDSLNVNATVKPDSALISNLNPNSWTVDDSTVLQFASKDSDKAKVKGLKVGVTELRVASEGLDSSGNLVEGNVGISVVDLIKPNNCFVSIPLGTPLTSSKTYVYLQPIEISKPSNCLFDYSKISHLITCDSPGFNISDYCDYQTIWKANESKCYIMYSFKKEIVNANFKLVAKYTNDNGDVTVSQPQNFNISVLETDIA